MDNIMKYVKSIKSNHIIVIVKYHTDDKSYTETLDIDMDITNPNYGVCDMVYDYLDMVCYNIGYEIDDIIVPTLDDGMSIFK